MVDNQETLGQTELLLRERYSFIAKSKEEEIIIAITNFIDRQSKAEIPIKTTLDEMTSLIHRIFDFQYVCMAIKDSDGKYRYKTATGVTPEVKKNFFEIEYSLSELLDESLYPSSDVSDITKMYMAESVPYTLDEVDTYSRPILLGQKRESTDDMLEADYIDIYIKGKTKNILGFIELTGTRNHKLPDRITIRWIEIIARMLAIIFSREVGE